MLCSGLKGVVCSSQSGALQKAIDLANLYVDRHMLSAIRVLESDARTAKYEANFCVFQSDQGGRTKLFCTGMYEGEVSLAPQPLFVRQEVIVDTFSIPALLAVPI